MFRSDIVTVLTAMLVAGCSGATQLFDGLAQRTPSFPCRELDFEGRELRDHLARTIAAPAPRSMRAQAGLPILPADSVLLVY